MAHGHAPSNEAAAFGAAPGLDSSETAFNAALLREQYRSLTRLGPYVHGIIIVAALAFFGATPSGSVVTGLLLPTALITVSVFRLVSWLRARANVEVEALDRVRRKVRAASVLGPTLTLAFALAAATSTWQNGVVEFALALLAVWVIAAVCAMCLNRLAGEANVIVIAATAPLVIAFLARDSALTFGLAALVSVAAFFIMRMLDEHFRLFAEILRSRFVIAEQQRLAEAARQAAVRVALTDDLTGLPNRRCFQRLLAETIRTAKETGEPFALGLIDLDGFKPINDLHGHPVGDDILRQVAGRLARAMEGRGSVARMGGDEFALICNGTGAREEAAALGEDISAIFAAPFDVSVFGVRLSCASGFALFPESALEANELVRLADAALYRAKAGGRGRAAVFDAEAGRAEVLRAVAEFATRTAPLAGPRSRAGSPIAKQPLPISSWPAAKQGVQARLDH